MDQVKCIVLLAIVPYALVSQKVNKSDHSSKIVKGVNATLEKWPFIVQVLRGHSFLCGGCVLTDRWVLTAGHCMRNATESTTKNYFIYTESILEKNGTRHDVATIVMHEKFKKWPVLYADIAMVQVKDRFSFSKTLQSIKLNFIERLDESYKECSTAGWGYTFDINEHYLQELEVYTISYEECKPWFKTLHTTNLCIRGFREGASPCRGDSGGPLVCDGFLVGVVSFGAIACDGVKPQAYTKVSAYYTWIRDIIKRTL